MTLYDDLRATATELLNEFGGAATLERRTKTFDPATRASTHTPANFAVKAVLQNKTERRGEVVERTTHAIIDSTVEPKPGDTLLMAGVRYPVGGVTSIAPDGAAIVYRCALGGA